MSSIDRGLESVRELEKLQRLLELSADTMRRIAAVRERGQREVLELADQIDDVANALLHFVEDEISGSD